MDFMYTIDDTEGIQNCLGCKCGWDATQCRKETLVRAETIGSPTRPVAPYVDELTPFPLWVVDGIGRKAPTSMRGCSTTATIRRVDYELYGGTEANGFLAWRPMPAGLARMRSYEWQPGSLANGVTFFHAD